MLLECVSLLGKSKVDAYSAGLLYLNCFFLWLKINLFFYILEVLISFICYMSSFPSYMRKIFYQFIDISLTLVITPLSVSYKCSHLIIQNLVEEKDKKVKELQDNIAAVNFTPQSKMGKILMAKCRTLQEENEEIGNQASEGKVLLSYLLYATNYQLSFPPLLTHSSGSRFSSLILLYHVFEYI